jgi:hypothetical protein
MINVYKNKSLHNYRTASVLREDRTQYSFKYRRMTNEDVSKVQLITGLRTEAEQFIIATTNQFDFSILNLPVIIDNVRYTILDSYREDQVNTSGLFRQAQLTTYLRVGN